MGESLTERHRVKEEGLRVVNFFYVGRIPHLVYEKRYAAMLSVIIFFMAQVGDDGTTGIRGC